MNVAECGMIPAFRVIEFFADRDLWLHGVYICGISNISNCPIELSLWNKKRKLTEVSGKFSAEIVHRPYGTVYAGFKILFEKLTPLRKNTTYRVEAKIFSTVNWAGDEIISTLTCSGVTFTFIKTSVEDFPELLFSF